MAGICGVWIQGDGHAVTEAQISAMNRLIGCPESGEGETVAEGAVALGARSFPGRLNVLQKRQVGGHLLIFALHGSLYEREAPRRLAGDGFGDPGDTLFDSYLDHGIEFVKRLRGDFSVAVWDGREQTLYLATDRFRVHPLYYYLDGEKLLFASRIRGIILSPFPVACTIQPEAIVQFVTSSIVPTPMSIYKEVRKIPPGSIFACGKGVTCVKPYWDVRFVGDSSKTEKELAVSLRSRFEESLAATLGNPQDNGTVGAFLSGGVDSSSVTGMLTRLLHHPVKSFSIGFMENRFNEIEYARHAARFFSADHHEYFVSPADAFRAIPMLLEAYDEPFANSSSIPTFYCAQLAKSCGVKYLFAGDGGDELFAGNERYANQRLFEYYHRIPAVFRKNLLEPLVYALASRSDALPIRKGRNYIDRANIPYPDRISSYDFYRVFGTREFLSDAHLAVVGWDYDPYEIVRTHFAQAPADSNLERHLFLDWHLSLTDNDLVKVTRMTEYAGVAVRYPFLDYPLVEFSTTVPSGVRMRGMKLRTFFKRAFRETLPPETRKKRKHGFGLPISVWLRTDPALRELMRDTLTSALHLQRGYFRREAVEDLIRRHQEDETTFFGAILWNLLILELWHRKYHDNRT